MVSERLRQARQIQVPKELHGTFLGKTLEQFLQTNTGNGPGNVVAVTRIAH
jgi:hypothetical protein